MTTKPKYPVRVLSFGAGIQSTTILRMMITGEIEPADHLIFADTGWEPQNVYDNMQKTRSKAESAGMQFHIVNVGNIRDDALNPETKFASMPVHIVNKTGKSAIGRRQCTKQYKIRPILEKQRELAGFAPFQRSKQHRITNIVGISWDESHRMRDPAFSWIRNEYPLVDKRITRQDCIDWNEKHGFEQPPRSACIGCPYKSNAEWLDMKQNDPVSWADAVEFDNQLRDNLMANVGSKAFLHRQRVPLTEANFGKQENENNLFDEECEGMCGL